MKLSVVIPTCDRPAQLRECLRRVMRQQGAEYEVIVTDDGRLSAPPDAMEGARWVQGPRRGPAANRNSGARHATGEWLVFLDDDCLPEEGWLAAYSAAAAPGVEVMEGRTECPDGDSWALREIVENLNGGAFWSCNLAVRRDRFEEMGGFDEDFTQPCAEDMELAWRMRQRNLRCVFVHDARVTHPPRRVGPRRLLRRMAAHRWVLLYRLKTGIAPGLECNRAWAALELAAREWLDTLRMLSHLRRPGERRLKGRTLEALWRCAMLPAFLPYYLCWDARYRCMLAARARGEESLERTDAGP
jgi:GT2 family glycosyltransferase